MKKTFQSNSFCNIFNFHNSFVWNPSKVERSLFERVDRFLYRKFILSFIGKEISGTITFPIFVRRRVRVIIAFLSSLFKKRDWLHLPCFSFIGAWILSTFEEMYLNFSSSPGWTFWRDNSWWRSTLNDVLSKWLKPLYWMILGLCFAWKSFKTLMLIYGSQTNLSHKHLTNVNFLGGL